VYRAQSQMSEAMSARFKALGIPFFGTPPVLIVSGTMAANETNDTRPKWSPLVTSTQLLALKRRMVEYLEDMYQE